MDLGLGHRAAGQRAGRLYHPLCPHSEDERRELQAQAGRSRRRRVQPLAPVGAADHSHARVDAYADCYASHPAPTAGQPTVPCIPAKIAASSALSSRPSRSGFNLPPGPGSGSNVSRQNSPADNGIDLDERSGVPTPSRAGSGNAGGSQTSWCLEGGRWIPGRR